MPESFLTATVMPATKWLGAKATCCWRATELVVVAQSRSTVPFCIRGMRLSEVRVVYSTRSAGKPSLAFTASTILRQMSFENPIGSLPPLATYENGMELSRLPMRMTPLSLILRSVSMSWADTTWDTRAAPSSRASGNWARRFMVRRLHSREQAGVIDSAPTRSTARASSAGGGCENSGATLNSKKAIFCCDLTFHKAIERRTMMTFKQLEALYWIVQLGGFAPAAQKLHTSQSAHGPPDREGRRDVLAGAQTAARAGPGGGAVCQARSDRAAAAHRRDRAHRHDLVAPPGGPGAGALPQGEAGARCRWQPPAARQAAGRRARPDPGARRVCRHPAALQGGGPGRECLDGQARPGAFGHHTPARTGPGAPAGARLQLGHRPPVRRLAARARHRDHRCDRGQQPDRPHQPDAFGLWRQLPAAPVHGAAGVAGHVGGHRCRARLARRAVCGPVQGRGAQHADFGADHAGPVVLRLFAGVSDGAGLIVTSTRRALAAQAAGLAGACTPSSRCARLASYSAATRSLCVTMPTRRRSAFSTGTWCRPWSDIRGTSSTMGWLSNTVRTWVLMI